MEFLLILLLVVPLNLAEDPIQRAIRKYGERVSILLNMTKNDESINNVLKPLSFLSCAGAGFIFKGIKSHRNIPVDIKFFTESNSEHARNDYAMYSYLGAVNKSEVEKYGIATVYYYGHWEGLSVVAYTELEGTLKDEKSDRYYDILLLIQQFMRQSKYIHSRGIRHDDISPETILLRGCESFLIDFNFASKMAEDNGRATPSYASLKCHQGLKRVATDDWESFLYTVCPMAGIYFDWFTEDLTNENKLKEKDTLKLIGELKSDRKRIFEVISESKMGFVIPILEAFAEEALSGKEIPDYDRIYNLVTDALAKHFPTKTCFSWTQKNTDESERAVKRAKVSNTDISDLVIPKDFRAYESFIYPNVNEQFFKNEGSK